MYGSTGVAGVVPVAVLLVVGTVLGPEEPLALGPGPDIVEVTGGEPGGEEGPMNQERSRSADSKVDWLDDDGAEQVDQPETEDEGQEVSGKGALGAR